jgi:hypothetical protein
VKIHALLSHIRHTVLIWRYPTSDFSVISRHFADREFNDVDEHLGAVVKFLNEVQPSELQHVFHHWTERVKWNLANNRDYYHGSTTYPEFARPDPFWRATATIYEPPYRMLRNSMSLPRSAPRRLVGCQPGSIFCFMLVCTLCITNP